MIGDLLAMSDHDDLYTFRTNVVVTASAGTGKTFRLVALYALLTLGLTSRGERDNSSKAPAIAPRRIAAVTFSRAAAAEIRERVERVLRAVAGGSYDASTEAYRSIFAARAEKVRSPPITSRTMRERAEQALVDLPYALIDTLHGLAGRVVRATALELGVNPGFAVLDEDRARVSTDVAIEEVLSQALAHGDSAAVGLLDAGGGLAMARKRIADLLDRADEEGVSLADVDCTDFEQLARQWMVRLCEICEQLASEKSKPFAEPAEQVAQMAAAWLAGRAVSEDDLARVFEPLFARRAQKRSLPSEEAFVAFRESVRGETHQDRARRLSAFIATAHELTPKTRGMQALLHDIAERRASARRRDGTLGFGDMLRTARDALRDHVDLAAAVRSLFDVLLVDEFQDTSSVQRDLVYLLRERRSSAVARSAGRLPTAADLEPSGLLIVGDRKQSIYGFRGADVTVFTRVSAELAGEDAARALRLPTEHSVSTRANATLVSLTANRRSHPSLLSFVNWFAENDFAGSATYPFDIAYTESDMLRPDAGGPKGAPGPRVVVVDDRGDNPADFPPLVRGASGPMREALLAGAVVERAVRDPALGALSCRDIAILARRRSTLPLLEFALDRLEIPYVVAGRGLFETREVRDLFALLRLILDPYERHALATVLRGPAVCLTDTSLSLLSEPGRGLTAPDEWFRGESPPANRLNPEERARLAGFHERWEKLRPIALALGPADAIRYGVEKLDLDRVVAALPRAAQRFAHIERLIALASQRGGSLPGFVRWLDRQIADEADESESASLSEDADAVTLMTIHASKGLEFRAVVLVDLGAAIRAPPLTLALTSARADGPARLVARHTRKQGGTLFTPEAIEFSREANARETAERRRLTYVAMTRARERLFLLAPPAAPPGSAAATLRHLLPDLPTRCRDVVVDDALPYLSRDPIASPTIEILSSAEPSFVQRTASDAGPLAISTTSLATFDQCPRRYRFIHEMALEAPRGGGDVRSGAPSLEDRRSIGMAAHRVLEDWPLARWGTPTSLEETIELLVRQGVASGEELTRRIATHMAEFLASPYAARVRRARRVYREESFVVRLGTEQDVLSLRGTIDLLVAFDDGSADVIDYKSSWRPDAGAHDFQLHAYAIAARDRFGIGPVRLAIVNLSSSSEPEVVGCPRPGELAQFESRLRALRGRFTLARTSDHFPGIERPRCEALRCGFVPLCHRWPERN